MAAFAAAHGAPVAVTEVGVHRYAPGADAYLAGTLGVLDGMGAAHALWEFVVSAQRPLYNDFDIEGTPLQDVVEADFARNCARPAPPVAAAAAPVATAHNPWVWAAIGAGSVLLIAAAVRLTSRR